MNLSAENIHEMLCEGFEGKRRAYSTGYINFLIQILGDHQFRHHYLAGPHYRRSSK